MIDTYFSPRFYDHNHSPTSKSSSADGAGGHFGDLLIQCVNLSAVVSLLINPFDQVLNVVYKLEDFVKNQYKLRIVKYKYMQELKKLFAPEIKFIE